MAARYVAALLAVKLLRQAGLHAPLSGERFKVAPMLLTPHPDSHPPALRIEAEAVRRGGVLDLRYVMTGDVSAVRLPPAAAAERTDDLWQHTCFEAFVLPEPGEAYFEFNFAPSTQWAAYAFESYRAGMRALEVAPEIAWVVAEGRAELRASLALSNAAAWRVGLTAVIEDMAGARTYWALAHPPGRADFHSTAGFVLTLPEAEHS